MAAKQPAVYIMASAERGTLYIGITGSLRLRIWEPREGLVKGFTQRYGVKHLVWYEHYPDFPTAIAREKQLKKWSRAWKLELIETSTPAWRDLWKNLLDRATALRLREADLIKRRSLCESNHST